MHSDIDNHHIQLLRGFVCAPAGSFPAPFALLDLSQPDTGFFFSLVLGHRGVTFGTWPSQLSVEGYLTLELQDFLIFVLLFVGLYLFCTRGGEGCGRLSSSSPSSSLLILSLNYLLTFLPRWSRSSALPPVPCLPPYTNLSPLCLPNTTALLITHTTKEARSLNCSEHPWTNIPSPSPLPIAQIIIHTTKEAR